MCAHELPSTSRKCASISSSPSPSFLSVSLLCLSLPALLFQINAASSALYVFLLFLLVWQLLAPLNTCLCKSFFFPTKLSFHWCSAPVCCPSFCTSLHVFIFVLFLLRISPLICAVKNSVLLFLLITVKRSESYGVVGWQAWDLPCWTWSVDLLLVTWTSPGLTALALT